MRALNLCFWAVVQCLSHPEMANGISFGANLSNIHLQGGT